MGPVARGGGAAVPGRRGLAVAAAMRIARARRGRRGRACERGGEHRAERPARHRRTW
jgi:hypothetical protein